MYKKYLLIVLSIVCLHFSLISAAHTQHQPDSQSFRFKLSDQAEPVTLARKYALQYGLINHIADSLRDSSATIPLASITAQTFETLNKSLEYTDEKDFFAFATNKEKSGDVKQLAQLIMAADYLDLQPYQDSDTQFNRLDLLLQAFVRRITESPEESPQALALIRQPSSLSNLIMEKLLMSLWGLSSSKLLETPINGGFVFSSDASYVTQKGFSETLQIWNTQDDHGPFLTHEGSTILGTLSFSPDNHLLLVAHKNDAIVWNISSKDQKSIDQSAQIFQNASLVQDAQFSPNNELIVTALSDNTATIWDLKTRKCLHTLQHDNPVKSAQFSPDGKLLATLSGGNIITVWDLTKDTPDGRSFQGAGTGPALEFSADGRYLMTKGGKTVQIWNPHDGSSIQTLKNDNIKSAHISPDGERFIVIYLLHIESYETKTGSSLYRLHPTGSRRPDGHFSHDGKFIVVIYWNKYREEYEVKLYEAKTGIEVCTVGPMNEIEMMALNKNNDTLAIVDINKVVQVWKNGTSLLKQMGYDPQQLTLDQAVDFYQWVVKDKKPASTWKPPAAVQEANTQPQMMIETQAGGGYGI